MKLVNKFLWKFVNLFPRKTDVIHTDNEPYLLRFHIKHCGKLPGVYLHYFYKSDSDRHLHNHPWRNSMSLILSGGYIENKRKKEEKNIQTKIYGPGSINFLNEKTFHKIMLLSNKTWSLFISKNRVQEWGFLTDMGFVPHYKYADKNNTFITDLLGNRKKID